MNIAEQIKNFYTIDGALNIEKMDDFLEEINEKSTSQEFYADYSATHYVFCDGSVLMHCSTNDEVRAYGCTQ